MLRSPIKDVQSDSENKQRSEDQILPTDSIEGRRPTQALFFGMAHHNVREHHFLKVTCLNARTR
jgi:hypothetical protein